MLIRDAARGNPEAIETLLEPLLSEGETLISFGLGAKLGLIPTFDFYFLSDIRIGDLQVTPLTGALNIESAYLNKIHAFSINQPAISIWLRLFILSLYLLIPFATYSLLTLLPIAGQLLGFISAVFSVFVVYKFLTPWVKRVYLRFMKSGILIKLVGNPAGVLIFADRTKVQELIQLTKLMMTSRNSP
jgi:hypothetical protein